MTSSFMYVFEKFFLFFDFPYVMNDLAQIKNQVTWYKQP